MRFRYALLLLAVLPALAVPADDANPQPPASVVSVLDFGADGHDQIDDTAAFQAALDTFSGKPATGVVRVPIGTYLISKPLVYRGSWPHGVRIEGEIAAAGPAGSVLVWRGGAGTVLELTGCNATTVERIAISGGGTATTGIAVSYDHSRSQGTTNVTLRQCHVGDIAPDSDSAAIRIGYRDGKPDNYQCDSVVVDRCVAVGVGGKDAPGYGIVTGVANAKNFIVRDGSISGFRTGIRHGGSGFMQISGCYFGANANVDVWGAGDTIEVRSCNSEGSSRLFVGTMGRNAGSAILSNITWDGRDVPADDVVVSYGGSLKLEGCQLWNRRTTVSTCRVQVGPSNGVACSLDSSGNFFAQASKQPFVDGSRNDVTTDQNFYRAYPAFVRSFGDYGGVPGQLIPFAPLPAPAPPPETLRAKDLVLSGSIDFGGAGAGVVDGSKGPIQLNVAKGSSQSGTWFGDGKGNVTGLITAAGAWMFVHIADDVAPSQSLFLGAQHWGLPCYKDAKGEVWTLDMTKAKKGK